MDGDHCPQEFGSFPAQHFFTLGHHRLPPVRIRDPALQDLDEARMERLAETHGHHVAAVVKPHLTGEEIPGLLPPGGLLRSLAAGPRCSLRLEHRQRDHRAVGGDARCRTEPSPRMRREILHPALDRSFQGCRVLDVSLDDLNEHRRYPLSPPSYVRSASTLRRPGALPTRGPELRTIRNKTDAHIGLARTRSRG